MNVSYQIGIATETFDPFGWYMLETIDMEASDASALDRRVSRTATLDGGSVVNDSGYSPSDRTILLTFDSASSADLIDGMARLVKLYSAVVVSLAEGCYRAAPSAFRITNGKATITLLVIEALAETF